MAEARLAAFMASSPPLSAEPPPTKSKKRRPHLHPYESTPSVFFFNRPPHTRPCPSPRSFFSVSATASQHVPEALNGHLLPSANASESTSGDGSHEIHSTLHDADSPASSALEHGQMIAGACDALVAVSCELVAALQDVTFMPPVSCVYNPLVYAKIPHEQYIRRHGGRKVKVLLVGMNPGPYGMAQTGVPFGDSKIVQDFHGIFGNVGSPVPVHPKRPIYGFDCQRSEVSGQRLWGWAQHRFGSAAAFFKHFWVYNYCPLVFMEASGKNHTPDKLHAEERRNLETICNIALIKTVSILQPAFVVGIGKYAAKKVKECNIVGVITGEIIHPSPANPQANKEWSKKIESQLEQVGFVFPTL